MSKDGYAHPQVLVNTGWVAEHLDDSGVRLVEVDVDPRAYASGHLPNAIAWSWRTHIQAPIRRDIPEKKPFEQLLGTSGVKNDTTVILYGDKSNWFAAYAFWLLKYFGHSDVRLMNGGRKKWITEGRPLTTGSYQPEPVTYIARPPDHTIRALRKQVFEYIDAPHISFVDVRSLAEFSGEVTAPDHLQLEGAMRGGHIPGAVNISWSQTLQADGTFKPAGELQRLYENFKVTPDKNVVVYCRIGERSSHSWFVLKYLLGYPQVTNYDGSWAEWGNLIDAPIER
jgi:thiosulfate/3-mercaptopyruvate sulfurtransferase